jgi:hypothetical protein
MRGLDRAGLERVFAEIAAETRVGRGQDRETAK